MIKDTLRYPLGFGKFDLQTFAEGDAGDGGTGGTGGAPSPQVFEEMTDPETGVKVKVPAELKTFFGHIIAKTRKEAESKFKPMLEQFETEKTDLIAIKAEYEKIKEASMTAEERAQSNAKKVIDAALIEKKTALEEATTWKARYEKSTIKNDIMSSFGDAKLCNPGQAAMIFEMEGQAFISEVVDNEGKPTGQFETRVRLMLEDKNGNPEPVEGTPQELFKKWIELDRNTHHLLNTMSAGSGARGGVNRGGMNTEQFNNLSPQERMKRARQSQ